MDQPMSQPTMVHSYRPMKVVTYRCTKDKCGAEDNVRFFVEEQPAPVINCWKCHAGMQMPLENMLANRVGMFPVGPAVVEVQEPTTPPAPAAETPAVGLP